MTCRVSRTLRYQSYLHSKIQNAFVLAIFVFIHYCGRRGAGEGVGESRDTERRAGERVTRRTSND